MHTQTIGYIAHLFHPVGVFLSSALADVHLRRIDTAWLWGGGGHTGRSDSSSRWSLFKISSVPAPHICSAIFCFLHCRGHSPPADGRPRRPSPGCPESSFPPCPSSCRSCRQQREATERTRLANIRDETRTCEYARQRGQSGRETPSARLSGRDLD